MDGLPLWMQIALIGLLVMSLVCSAITLLRSSIRRTDTGKWQLINADDGLGWKLLAIVGIPATLLVVAAIAILAMRQRQLPSPPPPLVDPPAPTNETDDAIDRRQAAEDEAHRRSEHFRDTASDDEVAARAAELFGDSENDA